MNWYWWVGLFNLLLCARWLYRSWIEEIGDRIDHDDVIDWWIGIFGLLVLAVCIVVFWPLLVTARLLKLTHELLR